MRPLFVNLLGLLMLGLIVAAAFVVHLALGLAASGLACGVLYFAFNDGKGLSS